MVSITLLNLMLASSQVPSSLAPLMSGDLLLCSQPDETEKTCAQLDSFRALGGGQFSNVGRGRFVGDGWSYTVTITTIALVKDEALCGTLRSNDLAAAKLQVSGKVAGQPIPVRLVRAVLTDYFRPYLNKEACTVFEETPEGLVARTSFEGVHDPGFDGFVKWVAPSEGYRLP